MLDRLERDDHISPVIADRQAARVAVDEMQVRTGEIGAGTDRGLGRLVNVGTGRETSVNALYRLLSGIVGSAPKPAPGPLPPGDLRRMALDPALAAEVLGWRPWTHLEDGLAETVAYLRGV